MPLTSHCRNCGLPKSPDYYSANYCKECTDGVKAAREKAVSDNVDLGAAAREALAARAHFTHRNHIDPRFPMSKADYWAAEDPRNAPKETS